MVAARDKLLVTMRKMKAGAERSIKERQAAAEAAEARAAELAAEGAALKSRIQVGAWFSGCYVRPPCNSTAACRPHRLGFGHGTAPRVWVVSCIVATDQPHQFSRMQIGLAPMQTLHAENEALRIDTQALQQQLAQRDAALAAAAAAQAASQPQPQQPAVSTPPAAATAAATVPAPAAAAQQPTVQQPAVLPAALPPVSTQPPASATEADASEPQPMATEEEDLVPVEPQAAAASEAAGVLLLLTGVFIGRWC